MAVTTQYYFELFNKTQRNKLPDYKVSLPDILKMLLSNWHMTRSNQGLSLLAPGGGKMRNPGNKFVCWPLASLECD